MDCVIRVVGREFDNRELADLGLQANKKWKAGERRVSEVHGATWTTSGVSFTVEGATQCQSVGELIALVSQFVELHQTDLTILAGMPGVEGIECDFAIEWASKTVAIQSRFPRNFVRRAALLGMSITLSVYGIAD